MHPTYPFGNGNGFGVVVFFILRSHEKAGLLSIADTMQRAFLLGWVRLLTFLGTRQCIFFSFFSSYRADFASRAVPFFTMAWDSGLGRHWIESGYDWTGGVGLAMNR